MTKENDRRFRFLGYAPLVVVLFRRRIVAPLVAE